jgi:hypothetical protein
MFSLSRVAGLEAIIPAFRDKVDGIDRTGATRQKRVTLYRSPQVAAAVKYFFVE